MITTVYENMARRPRRTFTLLDAIVLVAATALGFAWVRSNWYFEEIHGLMHWLQEAPGMLGPLLVVWTIATVVLRLVPPRPPLRRLVLQPGFAACGSVAFAFMIQALGYLGYDFARYRGIPWYLFRAGGGLGPDLITNSIVGAPYHILVMAAWGLLFLVADAAPSRVGSIGWGGLSACRGSCWPSGSGGTTRSASGERWM